MDQRPCMCLPFGPVWGEGEDTTKAGAGGTANRSGGYYRGGSRGAPEAGRVGSTEVGRVGTTEAVCC